MDKENELHNKIQTLRSEFYNYIKKNRESIKDFGKLNQYNTAINNKFVELLILNELLHKLK